MKKILFALAFTFRAFAEPSGGGGAYITGPDQASVGSCVEYQVNLVEGQSTPANVDLQDSGNQKFFSDPGCSIPITSLIVDTPRRTYIRFDDPPEESPQWALCAVIAGLCTPKIVQVQE